MYIKVASATWRLCCVWYWDFHYVCTKTMSILLCRIYVSLCFSRVDTLCLQRWLFKAPIIFVSRVVLHPCCQWVYLLLQHVCRNLPCRIDSISCPLQSTWNTELIYVTMFDDIMPGTNNLSTTVSKVISTSTHEYSIRAQITSTVAYSF